MKSHRFFYWLTWPDLYLALLVAAIVTSALAAVLFVPIIPIIPETQAVSHAQDPDPGRRP